MRLPKVRFTVWGLMVVVAIAGLQFGYVKFIWWALADWGPNLPVEAFYGAPDGAEEAYIRGERERLITYLLVGPLLIANVALVGWAAMRAKATCPKPSGSADL